MVTIYCIEDCNSLKYVGSTKFGLDKRLIRHKYAKRTSKDCSSYKLDLDNCKIYSLETCNESNRTEREKYWINKIECVNINKLDGGNKLKHKEYKKQWHQNNKERMNKKCKLNWNKYKDETNLFRRKSVVNGSYEFIKMLEEF